MGSSIQQQYLVPGLWVRETHWSTSFSNSWRNPIIIILSSSLKVIIRLVLLLYCVYIKLFLLLFSFSLSHSLSLFLSLLARTRVDRILGPKTNRQSTKGGAGLPGRSPPPQHQQQSAARAPATLRSNDSLRSNGMQQCANNGPAEGHQKPEVRGGEPEPTS